ncbi:Neurexophilin [Branchiostoma belcheri]|nr:Neurexophilin [Branchiostoma belcheri]
MELVDLACRNLRFSSGLATTAYVRKDWWEDDMWWPLEEHSEITPLQYRYRPPGYPPEAPKFVLSKSAVPQGEGVTLRDVIDRVVRGPCAEGDRDCAVGAFCLACEGQQASAHASVLVESQATSGAANHLFPVSVYVIARACAVYAVTLLLIATPVARHLFSNRSRDETAPDVPWKPEYSGSRLISYRPAKHIYPRNTIQPARVVSASAVLRTLPWKPEYSGSRQISYRPAKHIYPRNTIQPARVVSAPAVLRTPDAEGARLSGLLREFSGSYRDIPADRDTATSAEFTEFHIPHPGSFYRVGAILFVTIRAKDMRNRPPGRSVTLIEMARRGGDHDLPLHDRGGANQSPVVKYLPENLAEAGGEELLQPRGKPAPTIRLDTYPGNQIVFRAARALPPLVEKTVGGDFFRAKIYTEWTKSSAPGRVRDYGNGTYGVTFRLLWAGIVTVSVRMVHSSSAVRVLKRLREEFPTNRAKFRRRYVSGNRTSDGWCSSHRSDLHSPEGGGICDFSDRYASVEWYCERPWNVTCDQSVYHGFDWFRSVQELGITEEERTYFKKG